MAAARILVVEDEQIIALDIQMRLVKLGYDVPVTVSSGQEALTAVTQYRPDLVLMDIRLRGEMDGVETAVQLRAQYDIPIIYLTAYADEPTLLRATSTSPYGYLLKPFSEHELHTTIQTVLFRRQTELAERDYLSFVETMRDTAARLNSSLNLASVLDQIVQNLPVIAPCQSAVIVLLDSGAFYPARTLGRVTAVPRPLPLTIAKVTNWPTLPATTQNEVLEQVGRWFLPPEPERVSERLAVPMHMAEHLLGVILAILEPADGRQAGRQADYHGRLQALANQAALAIQNARLYQKMQQQAAYLEALVAERTAELREQQNRLETIFNTVDEGIYLTDEDGHIQYANPALERITGFAAEEMHGRLPYIWRSEYTPAATIQEVETARLEEQMWQGEVVNRRKDGRIYDAALSIHPVFNDNNSLEGFVCVQRDITQIKELTRMRDQFVSRIGHELRTPITNIKLYLDLLAHGHPDRKAGYLTILHNQTDRLQNIVNAFLEISHLDAGVTPVALIELDLNAIIRDFVAENQERVEIKQIGLAFTPTANLPTAVGDPRLLQQVINRLFENAVNYTPNGGQISMTTRTTRQEGQTWVQLTIQDNGPGIAREEAPHIFDRFYRGAAAQDFVQPGVGLGLAISREILAKLHGKLTLDVIAGPGSAFTVWLPVAAG